MMHISAKTGSDIETLIELLIGNQKGLSAESDETIVTNLRHYEALQKAGKVLEATRASGLPSDIVAEDLRQANYHLGSILSEVTDDKILGRIFERFCMGK
ncbi:MAG: hypothetical protein ACOX5T_08200 [Candidatus Cryptobacteroides sp.]|jgi:tRNA modification GTPase